MLGEESIFSGTKHESRLVSQPLLIVQSFNIAKPCMHDRKGVKHYVCCMYRHFKIAGVNCHGKSLKCLNHKL